MVNHYAERYEAPTNALLRLVYFKYSDYALTIPKRWNEYTKFIARDDGWAASLPSISRATQDLKRTERNSRSGATVFRGKERAFWHPRLLTKTWPRLGVVFIHHGLRGGVAPKLPAFANTGSRAPFKRPPAGALVIFYYDAYGIG